MPRQDNESTMDYLGRTLDGLELHDMAKRARLGHFDDYFCPEEVDDGANMIRLVAELKSNIPMVKPISQVRIQEVIDLVMDGEFDGTKEESEQWAKSPDGVQTFRDLLNG